MVELNLIRIDLIQPSMLLMQSRNSPSGSSILWGLVTNATIEGLVVYIGKVEILDLDGDAVGMHCIEVDD